MALDNAKNFAKVTVSTGYDASATSIVLSSGDGAKLPSVSFNAVWWNATDYADPSDDPNVEIVRVTARSTDTLTVTRAQESTSASTKNTASKTYKMIAGLTAKTINSDIAPKDSPTFTGDVTLSTGSFKPLNSAGTAVFSADVSGGTALTVANNATATPTGNASNFSGLLLIRDSVNNQSAVFLIGNTASILIAQTQSAYSNTAATASKTNVYVNGSSVVIIENKTGSSNNYIIHTTRLWNTN